MPCSYDVHDRLEFLESDKEALLCLKLCYMPNEPLPNESLVLSKKTYATINHNLLCHKLWLWMRLYVI
jgi:hypothetical protein